jgi:hypothetical protein
VKKFSCRMSRQTNEALMWRRIRTGKSRRVMRRPDRMQVRRRAQVDSSTGDTHLFYIFRAYKWTKLAWSMNVDWRMT